MPKHTFFAMKITFKTLLLLIILMPFTINSQINIKDYEAQWEGKLPNKNTFNFHVSIEDLGNNTYHFKLSNTLFSFDKIVQSTSDKHLQFNIHKGLSFTGEINKTNTEIRGFINSGIYLYHTKLVKTAAQNFKGTWNVFLLNELLSTAIFLSIENVQAKSFDAFPFFGDKRFAGTWCMNAQKKNNTITFQDVRTGLGFKGKLLTDSIELSILLADKPIATTTLTRSTKDWAFKDLSATTNKTSIPSELNDGWQIAPLKKQSLLKQLEDSILAKKLVKTHSVLIAKSGKLIYEKYFSGYTSLTTHDQRSASKSISSALIGIAIDNKIIKDDNELFYNYIPNEFQYTKQGTKSTIKLKDLLSMSSGIDAVDFGTKRTSLASEPNYQNSPNWLKTVLEAPMLHPPGTVANYGSANPYLLGIALSNAVSKPLELFVDRALLHPLGIANYVLQKDMNNTPYFGGGMYLTPRDMLKFGQLYLQKGSWNGKQIISEKWVEKSFKNYRELQNTKDKNGYGYLWWHKTYKVHKKEIKSIEARGAGGQYIFVIPTLDVVVVITSGNYRNGKFQQPEKILERYILPTLLNLK